jgi:hypothetical protein
MYSLIHRLLQLSAGYTAVRIAAVSPCPLSFKMCGPGLFHFQVFLNLSNGKVVMGAKGKK